MKMNYENIRRIRQAFWKICMLLSTAVTCVLLICIIGYVLAQGVKGLSINLLTTKPSYLSGNIGILPDILNTIYLLIVSIAILIPLGVGAAVYLSEYARNYKLVRMIDRAAEILSGIPSIIFGLFGMIFFGNTLKLGYAILTGAFTLTLMVLPLITRNTQEALRTVPDSYRSGALGMGATKWYMIRTILLPSSMSGIVTGIILAIGRIVGESAALLFTAGSGYLLPKFTDSFKGNLKILGQKALDPGGTLTIELYLQMQKGKYDTAFGIACVLIVIVLVINLLTKLAAEKLKPVKS